MLYESFDYFIIQPLNLSKIFLLINSSFKQNIGLSITCGVFPSSNNSLAIFSSISSEWAVVWTSSIWILHHWLSCFCWFATVKKNDRKHHKNLFAKCVHFSAGIQIFWFRWAKTQLTVWSYMYTPLQNHITWEIQYLN